MHIHIPPPEHDLATHSPPFELTVGRDVTVLTPLFVGDCREGTVQPGDIVKSIDGQPIGANTELDALRDMVVGEVGTFVSMALERPEDNDCYSAYEVSLMRGNEEYFAQLKVRPSSPPLP